MIVAVFRSRVRAEHLQEYLERGEAMERLARSMPGFVSVKDFVAEDGEAVSIHEWESAEQLAAWREHPEHKRTQQLGREKFYDEYTLYVCDRPRQSRFRRSPAGAVHSEKGRKS